MECHDASTLISAYLDGELTQADSQRMRLHIEDCPECGKTCSELHTLKEKMGQLSYPDPDTEMLNLLENEQASQLGQWSGWLLILIPVLILMAFAVYQSLSEPGTPFIVRFLFGAFQLGMAILFVTVLRQRLISYKNDKYRNVKL